MLNALESTQRPPLTLADRLPQDCRSITINGHCMEPFFKHDDIVLIRPCSTANHGDTVIVELDGGDPYCKIYRNAGGVEYLECADPQYPAITDRFNIVAVVVGFFRLASDPNGSLCAN